MAAMHNYVSCQLSVELTWMVGIANPIRDENC
jgi:hypothetical protein